MTFPVNTDGYPREARRVMTYAFNSLVDEWTADVAESLRDGMRIRLAEEIVLAFNAGYRTRTEIIALLQEEG